MPRSFINAYLEHTSIFESPVSFWKWSAYSTIASVLKDRCYKRDGNSLLFPNLYIMFLAASSGDRKNRPVDFSETLINKIGNIKTISGKSSVEGILDELARTETDIKTGKVIKSSSATFFAPELSASITADPRGLKTLTDIYDYKTNPYKHRLRTGPSFNLDRLVFSMLAASNEAMLRGFFDQSTIQGGFLARTLLITPNEFREGNSLFRIDYEALDKSESTVLTNLKHVAQLHGEFHFEDSAIDEYDSWYLPFRKKYHDVKDLTGFVGRVHTHVIKVAMILAADELTQCVLKRHIEQAIEECLSLMKNYNTYTMNNAQSEIGQVAGAVIQSLLKSKNYMLSRKLIIRDNWQIINVELMDKAILALQEAGFIQQHLLPDGIHFQLTQQALQYRNG